MENIQLLNCDCLQYMASLPDKHFDLAICDPDFGLDDKIALGGTWAAKYKKGDGNLGGKPTQEYFEQLFRVSKNQIIWGGNYFELPPTRCFIIWDKVAQMDTLADCEMAWTSFDRNAKIFRHVRNTSETRIHICQKPIKLYRWLLKNYANEGDKIFDSHGGSFSSAIAVHEMNKHHNMNLSYVGFEIDTDYFEAGKLRYDLATRQTALSF